MDGPLRILTARFGCAVLPLEGHCQPSDEKSDETQTLPPPGEVNGAIQESRWRQLPSRHLLAANRDRAGCRRSGYLEHRGQNASI